MNNEAKKSSTHSFCLLLFLVGYKPRDDGHAKLCFEKGFQAWRLLFEAGDS